MAFVDTIVNVSISATSATPTVQNSSTPAVLAYHTHNTDQIRTYNDLDGMVSDGFSIYEPAYLAAAAICAQDPRPASFKVIRGSTSVQQTFTFQVIDHGDGQVIGLSIQSPTTGVVTDMFVTASSQTAIQVATALAALVPSGVTAASGGTDTVTFTVTTHGNIWYPSAIAHGNYVDTTASASVATDLDAAFLVDNDWYGLGHTWIDATNIDAVADWVATNGKKIHAYTTADTNNVNAQTGIFNTLTGESYKRSYGQVAGYPSSAAGFGALGLMAGELTADPGSSTWAFKGIPGASVDVLNPTQITNIRAKKGNFYIYADGVNRTFDGKSAQGLYMDITQGIDALSADIQLRVVTLLYNAPKVPYTRKGMAAIKGEVEAALQAAVGTGFVSDDVGFQYSVSVPALENVSTSDKQNRILRNVKFTCYAQGAIQTVFVSGVVNI
jgi:hypothetical protein